MSIYFGGRAIFSMRKSHINIIMQNTEYYISGIKLFRIFNYDFDHFYGYLTFSPLFPVLRS